MAYGCSSHRVISHVRLLSVCVQELQCDVSVEEDSRQEWTFTLYDFDNNGKVTREVSAPAWPPARPRPRAQGVRHEPATAAPSPSPKGRWGGQERGCWERHGDL